MFKIDNEKTIHITRGDIAQIVVTAKDEDGTDYTFAKGDVVRFKVTNKKDCEFVEIIKEIVVETSSLSVQIDLNSTDTSIGDLINKPTDYWYEVELNPDTAPQTILGYDEDGAKIFRLYPEGGDLDG